MSDRHAKARIMTHKEQVLIYNEAKTWGCKILQMKNDEPEKLDNLYINKRRPKKLEPSLKYIHLYIGIPGSKHVESHKKQLKKQLFKAHIVWALKWHWSQKLEKPTFIVWKMNQINEGPQSMSTAFDKILKFGNVKNCRIKRTSQPGITMWTMKIAKKYRL